MKITWLGHACFLITSDKGVRIVTDPYDEYVGFRLPETEADILTTSHSHADHYNIGAIRGRFKHFKEPGAYVERGIGITGIETWHDEFEGAKRGKNIIYCFDIDGLRVCHCGDLGHLPDEEQVREIGKVDILLIPVGGTYTIDYRAASELVNRMNPSITIPMHYKTEKLTFNLDPVDRFLSAVGGGERAGKSEIEVSRDTLSSFPKVLVLEC